jgi:hypothetical protein
MNMTVDQLIRELEEIKSISPGAGNFTVMVQTGEDYEETIAEVKKNSHFRTVEIFIYP